jgi:hypothetical protein
MKTIIAAAVIAIASATAAAESPMSSAFVDGNFLWEECRAVSANGNVGAGCISYIIGATDMGNRLLFCLPPGTQARQVVDIVRKFLENAPAARNLKADIIISELLSKQWPCTREQSSPPVVPRGERRGA